MIGRMQKLWARHKPTIVIVIVLLGSGVVLGAVRYRHRVPVTPTITLERGEFIDSTHLRGEVKALKSVTISAPAAPVAVARVITLALPPPPTLTQSIEAAMKTGKAQDVRLGCEQFLQSLSRFHEVSPCGVRGLASRPLAFARTGQVNFSTITILPPWPSGSGCVPR